MLNHSRQAFTRLLPTPLMWERIEAQGRATTRDRPNTFAQLSAELKGVGSDNAPPTQELESENREY
jgi:hypothetical protein